MEDAFTNVERNAVDAAKEDEAANVCTNDDCDDMEDVCADVERNAVDAAEEDDADCRSPTCADCSSSDRCCRILSISSSLLYQTRAPRAPLPLLMPSVVAIVRISCVVFELRLSLVCTRNRWHECTAGRDKSN